MTRFNHGWLKTCVAGFTALSLGVLPGCTGYSDTGSSLGSQALRLSDASDSELFRSVMFGDGKFVKMYPLIEAEKGLSERFPDPKLRADVRKVVDLAMDRTARHAPSVMPNLAAAVRHGDHEAVKLAMARSSQVLRGEVEEIVRLAQGGDCIDAECLPPEFPNEAPGFGTPSDTCTTAECLPEEPGTGGPGFGAPDDPCVNAECLPTFPTCDVSQCSDAQISDGTCPCLDGIPINDGPGGQNLIVGPAVVAVAVAAVAVFVVFHATVGETTSENEILSEQIVDEIVATRVAQGM